MILGSEENMMYEDYEEKYFDGLDHGEARLKGIKAALDDALQQQDSDAVMLLYDDYINEDVMHGSSYKAIIIFPEYVAYFESHPELYEEYNHNVMWSYKWIINDLDEFYQIPLEKIEDLYNHYREFCKRFNYNLRTYYDGICFFAADNLEEDVKFCGLTAKEAHAEMMKCKRDSLSDCVACETSSEVSYLMNVEKDMEKAMKKAQPLIDGKYTCAEQPHCIFANIAVASLKRGDLENAAKFAQRSFHLINRDFPHETTLFDHQSKCMLVFSHSDPNKALKLLKRLLNLLKDEPNANEQFSFYRAAYYFMYQLDRHEVEQIKLKLPFKNEEIYKEDNIYNVTDLRDFFYDKAKEIAEKFDNRNHNTLYAKRLDEKYDVQDVNFQKPLEKLDYPILDYIRENMVDGALPDDFILPEGSVDDEGDRFIDGAMDGILLYHNDPQINELGRLEDIIKDAAAGSDAAIAKTDRFFEKEDIRALTLVDNVQKYILSNQETLDANNMYKYAIYLTVSAKNKESVKIGLSILEIFCDYNDALLEAILDLAKCNEFTLFCIWAVRGLENGNELIFSIAQNVYGWGRIFAVDDIDPDTDEIKEWILNEGIKNSVYAGYSAITSFKKAEVHSLLENGLTQQQLTPVGAIIAYLVLDGPTIGIKAFDDGDNIINMYLDSAEKLEKEEIDTKILQLIGANYDNDEIKNRIVAMGIDITDDEES